MISREGGVLVYLRQEGRGIGLNAKIDAYDLQSKGYDTFAANRALGHPEDARDFGVAADILRALGIGKIRLITGNPEKVDALRKEGIDIVGVLDTPAFETQENAAYLRAKRDRYDCETNERDEDRK
jgi:GTP cyclohydrolase II